MSKLMTGSGATQIDRAQLKTIHAPKATATWHPVKHFDLLTEIEAALHKREIAVVKEQLAVQRRGELFYGVLDLAKRDEDGGEFTSALGVRASNNKLMAIQIAVGARVFVCDNLMFQGDMIALKRKHTSGLNLAGEVDVAINKFSVKFAELSHEIVTLKGTELTDSEAKACIFDAFATHHILPVRMFDDVAKEYFKPSFPEFESRTAWSLYNSFTFAAKELPPERKFRALRSIGQLFNKTTHKGDNHA